MSDWDTVTVLKKKPLKSAQMKTESAINQASECHLFLSFFFLNQLITNFQFNHY